MKDSRVEFIRNLMKKANEVVNEKIVGVEQSTVPIELKLTSKGVLKGVGQRTSWCNVLESKLQKLEPIQKRILRLIKEGTMIPDEWLIKESELRDHLEHDEDRYLNRK